VNKTLKEIANIVKGVEKDANIYILGHIGPDGDCIGSSIGLSHALIDMGYTNVKVLLEKVVDKFEYMYTDNVIFEYDDTPADLAIMVDIAEKERLLEFEKVIDETKYHIIIDHHEKEGEFADAQYINSNIGSCAEIIYDFINELGTPVTKDIAECLYTGMITDTGLFRYDEVNGRTYEVAGKLVDTGINKRWIIDNAFFSNNVTEIKLLGIAIRNLVIEDGFCYTTITNEEKTSIGATDTDFDIVKVSLANLEGIGISIIFREYKTGVKVSFRSKCDLDVNGIAEKLGGAGHKKAAGATDLYADLEDIKTKAIKLVRELVKQTV
jgi:phosphoesterase RecJ-like protein